MRRTLDKAAAKTLGENLKEMREHRRLTQVAAAKAASISRTLVTKWETAVQAPGIEGLLLMAVTYRCPIDQLLSGVDGAYDDIIEGRLPVDAVRHYRAKVAAFTREGNKALAGMRDALAPAPTTTETAAGPGTTRGKSVRARVRRKLGK